MKKDPLMIINELLEALNSGRAFSMNELSRETGMHNVTVKKYIQIIRTVREAPDMEVIQTRHSVIVRINKNK